MEYLFIVCSAVYQTIVVLSKIEYGDYDKKAGHTFPKRGQLLHSGGGERLWQDLNVKTESAVTTCA